MLSPLNGTMLAPMQHFFSVKHVLKSCWMFMKLLIYTVFGIIFARQTLLVFKTSSQQISIIKIITIIIRTDLIVMDFFFALNRKLSFTSIFLLSVAAIVLVHKLAIMWTPEQFPAKLFVKIVLWMIAYLLILCVRNEFFFRTISFWQRHQNVFFISNYFQHPKLIWIFFTKEIILNLKFNVWNIVK